jgi:predicted RNA-binding protein with PUA-like domain
MNYWLVKTEPEAFSWDQQVHNRVEPWTGVRNHAARNHLRAMRLGDQAFFYHSGTGREIVGIVSVVREAYPDPTATSGDWVAVDMQADSALPRPVTLAAMKADPALEGLTLLRLSRLSVVPVSAAHWRHIRKLGNC